MEVAGGGTTSTFKDLDDIFGDDDHDGYVVAEDAASVSPNPSADSVHSQLSVAEVEPEDKPTPPDAAPWAVESKPTTFPSAIVDETTAHFPDDVPFMTPNASLEAKALKESESLGFLDIPSESNPTALAHSHSNSLSFLDVEEDIAQSHAPSDSLSFLNTTGSAEVSDGYVEAPLSPFSQFMTAVQPAPIDTPKESSATAPQHDWDDLLDVSAPVTSLGDDGQDRLENAAIKEAEGNALYNATDDSSSAQPALAEGTPSIVEVHDADSIPVIGEVVAIEAPMTEDTSVSVATAFDDTSLVLDPCVEGARVGGVPAADGVDDDGADDDTAQIAHHHAVEGATEDEPPALDSSPSAVHEPQQCSEDAFDDAFGQPSPSTAAPIDTLVEESASIATHNDEGAMEVSLLDDHADVDIPVQEINAALDTEAIAPQVSEAAGPQEILPEAPPQLLAAESAGLDTIEGTMEVLPSGALLEMESGSGENHEGIPADDELALRDGSGAVAPPETQEPLTFDFPAVDASADPNSMQFDAAGIHEEVSPVSARESPAYPIEEMDPQGRPVDAPQEHWTLNTPSVDAVGNTIDELPSGASFHAEILPGAHHQDFSSEHAMQGPSLELSVDSPESPAQSTQEPWATGAAGADALEVIESSFTVETAATDAATIADDFVVLAAREAETSVDGQFTTTLSETIEENVVHAVPADSFAPSFDFQESSDFVASPPAPVFFPATASPESNSPEAQAGSTPAPWAVGSEPVTDAFDTIEFSASVETVASDTATSPTDFVAFAPSDVDKSVDFQSSAMLDEQNEGNVVQPSGDLIQAVPEAAAFAPSFASHVPSAFEDSPPMHIPAPASPQSPSLWEAPTTEEFNPWLSSPPKATVATGRSTNFQTAPPPSTAYNPFEVMAQEELKSATAFPWLNFQSAPVANDKAPIDTNNPWASATPDTDDFDGFVNVTTSARAAIIHSVAAQATSSWLDIATSQATKSTDEFGGAGDRDRFGAFGGESTGFGDFSEPAHQESFGDFSAADNTSAEFGDFGDFTSGAAASAVEPVSSFSDFGAPPSTAFDDNNDDFGDFESSTPADATAFGDFTSVQAPPSVSTVPFDEASISALFAKVFPVLPPTAPALPPSTLTTQQILGSVDFENTQKPIVCTALLDALVKDLHANHAKWDARTSSVREEAAYVLQQCKAALAQKVNEAVVHHALFSEKSPAYAEFQSLIHTSEKAAILAGLRKLQLDIFDDMSNKATLSMAEQAALSAQATIASHAQQHKDKVPGLKFQFAWPTSKDKPDHDDRAASVRVLTPTGASISKLHKNSFSNLHASTATAGGSEGEHTSGSDGDGDNWETASATSDGTTADDHNPPSRTGSGSLAGAVSGTGLMKKLSSKLGFSSLRSSLSLTSAKTKVVSLSLRRKGDAAVRTFDVPLDTISGGFDELKWKCAVYLYDADEVAAVAPSQIQVIASNGVVVSSADRSALQKLLKEKGAVWTIDVGTDAKESSSDTA